MKILLDTLALIWFSENDKQLSKKAKETIEDIDTTVFISAASLWEMAIKLIYPLITKDSNFIKYKVKIIW